MTWRVLLCAVVFVSACGGGAVETTDATLTRDAGPPGDARTPSTSGSIRFSVNPPQQDEYGQLLTLPPGFGAGEFTFEIWIKPEDIAVVGPTSTAEQKRVNWSTANPVPYSFAEWWFEGNFLIDGHTNNGFPGTFSIQLFDAGRVRWLFEPTAAEPRQGEFWTVQWQPPDARPPSLLDDRWHHVGLVRRFVGAQDADLELWVDGTRQAVTRVPDQSDMRAYWDTWSGFRPTHEGWMFGAEKYSALSGSTWENFKGLVGEIRFWSIALSPTELTNDYDLALAGDEPGLVGLTPFDEQGNSQACDIRDAQRCVELLGNVLWVAEGPPLRTQ